MNYQYYTVVSGDSLWGIATRFGLTVNELMALNGMTSTNQVIHPGDRLIVGQSSQTQPDPSRSICKINYLQLHNEVSWTN